MEGEFIRIFVCENVAFRASVAPKPRNIAEPNRQCLFKIPQVMGPGTEAKCTTVLHINVGLLACTAAFRVVMFSLLNLRWYPGTLLFPRPFFLLLTTCVGLFSWSLGPYPTLSRLRFSSLSCSRRSIQLGFGCPAVLSRRACVSRCPGQELALDYLLRWQTNPHQARELPKHV